MYPILLKPRAVPPRAVSVREEMLGQEGEFMLADLLSDTPGTEDLVESVRDEAKRRRVAGLLVERNLDRITVAVGVVWAASIVAASLLAQA